MGRDEGTTAHHARRARGRALRIDHGFLRVGSIPVLALLHHIAVHVVHPETIRLEFADSVVEVLEGPFRSLAPSLQPATPNSIVT